MVLILHAVFCLGWGIFTGAMDIRVSRGGGEAVVVVAPVIWSAVMFLLIKIKEAAR